MGIVRGLGKISKFVDDQESRRSGGDSDGVKTKWFKIEDKQSVKVIFLQELDEDSENYSAKNGLGFLAVEHSSPADFKRKALCTMAEEDACWACEQNKKDYKSPDWRPKTRLFINVLVDNGVDEPFVAVLSQGTSAKQITGVLIEYAGDDGSITDKFFNIKRTGSEFNDTSYSIRALKEHGLNVEDYELFDLDKVVRQVPYAEQEAHYRNGEEVSSASEIPVTAGASSGAPLEW